MKHFEVLKFSPPRRFIYPYLINTTIVVQGWHARYTLFAMKLFTISIAAIPILLASNMSSPLFNSHQKLLTVASIYKWGSESDTKYDGCRSICTVLPETLSKHFSCSLEKSKRCFDSDHRTGDALIASVVSQDVVPLSRRHTCAKFF